MNKLWIILAAFCLLAVGAFAQTAGQLAPFASSQNCPGLIFSDDFTNGLSQWSFGGGGSLSDGNNAFASYQGPTQNQTEQSTPNGLNLSILKVPAPNGAAWQAGLMSTRGKFQATYGYYEINVYLSAAMLKPGATWAFWLIGNGWPPENDISEFSTPNGNEFDSAQHSAVTSDNAPHYVYNFQPGWHVFASDWEPNKITWYIDGQQTQQSNTPADFNQPMYIVLGSAATSNITEQATLQVKYVRVFKNMQAALACVQNVGTPSQLIAQAGPGQSPGQSPGQTPGQETVSATPPPMDQQTLNDLNQQIAALTAQTAQPPQSAPGGQTPLPVSTGQPNSIGAGRAQQLLNGMQAAPTASQTTPVAQDVVTPQATATPTQQAPAPAVTPQTDQLATAPLQKTVNISPAVRPTMVPTASTDAAGQQAAVQELTKALQDLQAAGGTVPTIGQVAPVESQVGIGQRGWHPQRQKRGPDNDNGADAQ